MAETDVHAEADAAATKVDGRAEFRWVAVGEIHPAEDNLRRELGDLSDLGSVATVGVLEPLLLTPRAAGGYTVVAGHRRHAAAAAAGLVEVPAMVRPYTADQRVEVMLIENLQRRGLSPLEEALGYRRLLDLGLRQRALAERLGVSQSHVSKRLALLSLPPAALEQLDSGGITVTDALELSKLVDHPARVERVIAGHGQWRDIPTAVRHELGDLRDEAARDKARRELKAQGVKAVDGPQFGSWYDRKEKPLSELRLAPEKHATQKCHAAAVMTDGKIVMVCRKPENHASPAQLARIASETEAQRAEREKDKAIKAAAKARDEHWRELLDGSTTRVYGRGGLGTPALAFVFHEAIRGARSRGCQMACTWLRLEPERNQWGTPAYSAALITYAAQGAEQLHRAALAVSLGEAEEAYRFAYGGGEPGLSHVNALLEATGYTLTQVELDRVTPREDDDPAAALVDDLAREALREGGRGLTDDGEEDDVARCRVCGCTEDEPCEGGCQWVEDPLDEGELCSRCAGEQGLAGADEDLDGEGEG